MISIACLLAAGNLMIAVDGQTASPDVSSANAQTAARPTADHDRLDALAGRFRFERSATTVAGRPAERTTGRSENRWVLDSHYLECRFVEGPPGAEAETAVITYGFDLRRRVYFSLAVGSRGTNYRNLEGFWDEPARSLVLLGKDAGDGNATQAPGPKLRQVLHIESRDRHVVEMFVIHPGRLPQRSAEIVFTRE
jgi:hypothetical protein